jgi:hypothetical protein
MKILKKHNVNIVATEVEYTITKHEQWINKQSNGYTFCSGMFSQQKAPNVRSKHCNGMITMQLFGWMIALDLRFQSPYFILSKLISYH